MPRLRAVALSIPVLVAVIAAATTIGDGSPTEPTAGVRDHAAKIEFVEVDGSPAAIARPRRPNGALVIYAHGATGDERTVVASKQPARLTAALLEAGYTVASSDAHGDSWGNDHAVRDITALVGKASKGPVLIVGQSMGGLAALRAIDPAGAVAFAGVFPVCNLASIAGSSTYAESVRSAWGRKLEQAKRDLSPVPAPSRTVPMIFWASDDDQAVDARVNARACASAYRRAGSRVEYVATSGDHNDPTAFQPQRLVEWADSVLRGAEPKRRNGVGQ